MSLWTEFSMNSTVHTTHLQGWKGWTIGIGFWSRNVPFKMASSMSCFFFRSSSPSGCQNTSEKANKLSRACTLHCQDIESFWPEWCISIIYHAWDTPFWLGTLELCDMLLVACLTSQQHAGVSQGQIYSNKFTCWHNETELADQTFYLTQSQTTDTWPTSHNTDPITPSARQSSHWMTSFFSHRYGSTHPVTVYWHLANQSQRRLYNARRLAGDICEMLTMSLVRVWNPCWLIGKCSLNKHSASQGWMYLDNSWCRHTKQEVADQACCPGQTQYIDTWPTSPTTHPTMPGAW